MNPYGCHNTEREPGYWSPQREYVEENWRNVRIVIGTAFIRDVTSKDCQYRKETPNDPRCEGCKK